MSSESRFRTIVALTLCIWSVGAAGAQQSLNGLLRPIQEKHGLPALAAAVVKRGRVTAAGAVGVRRVGTTTAVTINDRFHIGSNTKAMTALMLGQLVDEKKLDWNTTMAEVFTDLRPRMSPSFAAITIRQLLSHTSGLPSDNESAAAEPYLQPILSLDQYPDGGLDVVRRWLMTQWCARAVPSAPGRFEYSNLNYVIAGAVIERYRGVSWEEAIHTSVFQPLGMRHAGLGVQSSLGLVDAPLSHRVVGGKPVAEMAGPTADNPQVVGPAGTAHMSVLDFARWAGWNAGAGRRQPALVSAETLAVLHTPVVDVPAPGARPGTPPKGRYAMGWAQVRVPWDSLPWLMHTGSNGKNLAVIMVNTERDLALVAMTNIGGDGVSEALTEACGEMFTRFGR